MHPGDTNILPAKRSLLESNGVHQLPENSTHLDDTESMKKKKAKLKKPKKADTSDHPPELQFDVTGFQQNKVVTLQNVRDLILHILSDAGKQQWIFVKNKEKIKKIVLLFIPGIEPHTLGLVPNESAPNMPSPLVPPKTLSSTASTNSLPAFRKLFSHYCPTRAPGDSYRLFSCYHTLTTCPPSSTKINKVKEAAKKNNSNDAKSDPFTYILDLDMMLEQSYSIPSYADNIDFTKSSANHFSSDSENTPESSKNEWKDWVVSKGWIQTPVTSRKKFKPEETPSPNFIGIDCEMVTTELGSEIARVTLVDKSGETILDSFIQPSHKIVDYRTRYSGMTESKLDGITTTLEDVQRKLVTLIDYDTILVGHSLECDLQALQLIHPWVVDTALIYEHTRGAPFKPSLKWLAQKWLKREIQQVPIPTKGSSSDSQDEVIIGHDSEEDAKAALDLFKLKLVKGPKFGKFAGNDHESLLERIATTPATDRTHLGSAVVDHGKSGMWAGLKAKTTVPCQSDVEVFQGIRDVINSHDYVFARCMDLAKALGWNTKHAPPSRDPSKAENPEESITPESALEVINSQITELHDSLPPDSLLVLVSGHSDPREMSKLSAKKQRFEQRRRMNPLSIYMPAKPEDSLKKPSSKDENDNKNEQDDSDCTWYAHDDRRLQEEVEKARMGMAFFKVRH